MKRQQDRIKAFLGEETEFEGKLSFSGAVRIDGRFKGEILTDGTLIVGESALVESNIQAVQIIISGEVIGNIVAQKKIEIHTPGRVSGNISAPVITMDKGVNFDGYCRMNRKAVEDGHKVTVLRNDKTPQNKTRNAEKF